MAYTNKTYVCFDADSDIHYYRLMTAWKENDKIEFNFYNAHEINNLRDGSSETTIKAKLRERLQNTKVLVVLIGKKSANLYKYVRWEIEWAIENNIPIVAVNLNGTKQMDPLYCPPILKDKLAIHISFGQKIMDHALNNWPASHLSHRKANETGPYSYKDSLYFSL
ncbi:TIR domain-containing protein [Flavobacterium soyae]|uniref:TIR domain-containing protein n=1 Tax=Flavobacterium soyae TaxID=2903098 RepID=UPI001E28C044|nr:TIR domain-containing protein [Flavobacterium soyae]MCD9576789.1 TIR domain-containing protein [Flavobacterium soyae]